ncbi:MAG TPA: peptidoglycan-associated lipoprotein Pal [Steroidobacteraceae bacterium]|nr:peptidoglycan-associated lipoprotein Pal [Steroidobacteraceae bacterium]
MRRLLVVMLMACLGVVACASKHAKPTTFPPSSSASSGAEAEGAGANGANAAGQGSDEETAGPQGGLLAKRIVYFDFDSSEIKGDGTDIVAAHAKYLASNPTARVRLEGHTDDRGSREYNIGLGERRAQSVRRALLLQGASEAQLSTVSYGAERPAVAGHDEAAWSKNRRVEIVYLTPSNQPAR